MRKNNRKRLTQFFCQIDVSIAPSKAAILVELIIPTSIADLFYGGGVGGQKWTPNAVGKFGNLCSANHSPSYLLLYRR